MKRLILLILAIALAIGIFYCAKQQKATSTAEKFAGIKVEQVEPFFYVALKHVGPYADHEKVIGEFIGLVRQRQIPVTGPLMGIYYNDPEQVSAEQLQWAIAFQTKDSLTVAEPLFSDKWTFPQVLVYHYVGRPDSVAPVYHLFGEYMQAHQMVPAGPSLERWVDPDPTKVAPDSMKIDIWFPVTTAGK